MCFSEVVEVGRDEVRAESPIVLGILLTMLSTPQVSYCISCREMIYYMTWKELGLVGFAITSNPPSASCLS